MLELLALTDFCPSCSGTRAGTALSSCFFAILSCDLHRSELGEDSQAGQVQRILPLPLAELYLHDIQAAFLLTPAHRGKIVGNDKLVIFMVLFQLAWTPTGTHHVKKPRFVFSPPSLKRRLFGNFNRCNKGNSRCGIIKAKHFELSATAGPGFVALGWKYAGSTSKQLLSHK